MTRPARACQGIVGWANRIGLGGLLWLGGTAFAAGDIVPDNAMLQLERREAGVAHLVITDRVVGELAPGVVVPGALHRHVWHSNDANLTSLQMLETLIAKAEAEGLSERFRCATTRCGGFDFRLNAPIEPPPEMFINLADFHYAALHDAGETRWLTLLVSRSGPVLFVQVTEIAANGVAQPNIPAAATLVEEKLEDPDETAPAEDAPAPVSITQALQENGHVVIPGVRFASGSGAIGPEADASLAAIAAFLRADTKRRIALVGHSDATGGYDVNRRLSQQRASQLRDRLIEQHGVDPAQLVAYGAAWLAPRAENQTETGRALNRRVEAVLLSPTGG